MPSHNGVDIGTNWEDGSSFDDNTSSVQYTGSFRPCVECGLILREGKWDTSNYTDKHLWQTIMGCQGHFFAYDQNLLTKSLCTQDSSSLGESSQDSLTDGTCRSRVLPGDEVTRNDDLRLVSSM